MAGRTPNHNMAGETWMKDMEAMEEGRSSRAPTPAPVNRPLYELTAQELLNRPLIWVLKNFQKFSPLTQLQLKEYGKFYVSQSGEVPEHTSELHQPSPKAPPASILTQPHISEESLNEYPRQPLPTITIDGRPLTQEEMDRALLLGIAMMGTEMGSNKR